MPTPRPRYLSRITSPISTAPAAHSPPKPSPCKARNTKSCSKFCANAQRKVNSEYHRIVICSIRTRPNRSASVPENHPPSDEISNVTVPMSPASPRDSPHSAITVGITKLYICTSNASSAQPPKQAPIVRRSLAFNSPNQPSIALLLIVPPARPVSRGLLSQGAMLAGLQLVTIGASGLGPCGFDAIVGVSYSNRT